MRAGAKPTSQLWIAIAMGTKKAPVGNSLIPDIPTGVNPLLIGLLIFATSVAGAPVAGFVIVSIASRREDSNCSLGEPPRGVIEGFARRILNFHSDEYSPLRRTSRTRAFERIVCGRQHHQANRPLRSATTRPSLTRSARNPSA